MLILFENKSNSVEGLITHIDLSCLQIFSEPTPSTPLHSLCNSLSLIGTTQPPLPPPLSRLATATTQPRSLPPPRGRMTRRSPRPLDRLALPWSPPPLEQRLPVLVGEPFDPRARSTRHPPPCDGLRLLSENAQVVKGDVELGWGGRGDRRGGHLDWVARALDVRGGARAGARIISRQELHQLLSV